MTTADSSTGIAAVAAAIESAIEADRFGEIGDLFADSITWGDCGGKDDARAVLDQAAAAAPPIAGGTVAAIADRLIVSIRFDRPIDGADRSEIHSAVFVGDGRIVEIIDAADREHATIVQPVGPLPAAAERQARMSRLAPVLPVADMAASVEHYRKLGFEVRAYDGPAAYAFATRDDVEVHLAEVGDLDPKKNTSAVYLYVDDADALYASWRRAEVGGRLIAPTDTDYGLREGAHLDLDHNLLRFGSDIAV